MSQSEQAALLIQAAEADLGPLSEGQRVDLLLDNMPELQDSDAARKLVNPGTRDALADLS